MKETTISKQIRLALNRTNRVRLLDNEVGFASHERVRYGLGNGSPDLIGVLKGGRCFAVEVKTPTGRLSTDQLAWWKAARSWGVLGGVARSVAEAMQLLDDATANDQ